jgi:hypothetical protein
MITYDDAKRTLLELVEEKGADYVYKPPVVNGEETDCVYSTPPEGEQHPSCIVGHVINKLDPEKFREIAANEWTLEHIPADPEYYIEEWDGWLPDAESVNGLAATYDDIFDERAERLLGKVQFRQDRKRTWGDAVKESIEEIED